MPTITADGKYYVDLGSDPMFGVGSFVSIYPESLSFDDEIRGVGNCSWQISFSAKDQDGSTIISGHDVFGPYRTYYRLRYGNVAIQAGVLVSWTTILGSDYLSCAGKTWEHFFERWEYPFNGDPIHVNDFVFPNTMQDDELTGSGSPTPTGLVYQANNRDVIRILKDLTSTTMGLLNRIIFDSSSLTGLSGIKTNFQYSLGDNSKLFQTYDDLSGLGDGFDWWISHDMNILWASPYRFGNPSAPSLVFTFDNTNRPDDLEFTNNGPRATHVQGRGAGLATSATLSRAYGYAPSQAQFSRLDESYDFGDVRNVNELNAKTHKQLSLDLNPQHTIPLSIDPLRISGFWSNFRKGRAFYINIEMIAHKIDSAQRFKKYSCTVDDKGNAMVQAELEQIYTTSSLVGLAEG